MDGVFVQDGNLYSYVPAGNPGVARRDYNPSAVPTLFSPQLNETRGYRVFLPRGYDQHVGRVYPVLYMHDGQNVFEQGAFGTWNAAPTISQLTNSGQIREFIVVALDNGPNRLTDYLPPGDTLGGNGQGDRYVAYIRDTVKPFIDSHYRTIPGAATTGALGSSMGGVISLYQGWDYTSTFTRLGLMSGAWQTCTNFLNRVRATPNTTGSPPRAVRMWFDSGDSGTSNDNYWLTYGLRDFFAGGVAARYQMDGTIDHMIGFGQQHNEAAWAVRLPSALKFLYPADDEANTLLREVFGPQLDVDGDGRTTIEDLYSQEQSARDLNLDGTVNGNDSGYLARVLRRSERRDEIRP